MTRTDAYIKLVLARIANGSFSFRSKGDSMLPNIACGQILNIENPIDIQIGDVVLYYTLQYEKTVLVAHRLQYIYKQYCICKGDNNYCFDPPIKKIQILGKVVAPNIHIQEAKQKEAQKILTEWINGLSV